MHQALAIPTKQKVVIGAGIGQTVIGTILSLLALYFSIASKNSKEVIAGVSFIIIAVAGILAIMSAKIPTRRSFLRWTFSLNLLATGIACLYIFSSIYGLKYLINNGQEKVVKRLLPLFLIMLIIMSIEAILAFVTFLISCYICCCGARYQNLQVHNPPTVKVQNGLVDSAPLCILQAPQTKVKEFERTFLMYVEAGFVQPRYQDCLSS